MEQAVVYFVQDSVTGWVKIGHSSCLKTRLSRLRSNPNRKAGKVGALEVLATLPAKPRLEQRYHRKFAKERIEGEWFEPSLRLLAFVAKLQQPA